MTIREVMTTNVLYETKESDSLASAAHRMAWAGCRHLPVTEDREVVGESAARMIASRISCLPVVMGGRLVGMITSTDLLGRLVTQTFDPSPRDDRPAGAIMSPRVFTALPSDPLLEAADIMVANHVRHLPVVDDTRRLVGILSERDLRSALGRPAEALAHWPLVAGRVANVGEVMTSPVISIHAEQPLAHVITTMVDCGMGALPVVDRDNRPIGIVSYLDVLRAVRRERL